MGSQSPDFDSPMTGMLHGMKVIEFCQVLAGPLCCEILADLGAEVIKVEPVGVGDHTRKGWGTSDKNGSSAPFIAVNRNKKSVTLDVKSDQGRELFYRLAERADVVVENSRPGVMRRLGIDYDVLRTRNERLIFASISGFGQTGPYSTRPGYDIIAQGMSGVMSVTGAPGDSPAKCGIPIADIGAGLFAAIGIVCAYVARSRTGAGQYLETSLFEAALAMSVWEAAEYWATGNVPGPLGSAHRLNAPYQALRTGDGYITVGANTELFWTRLCEVLDRSDLIEDERFRTNHRRIVHKEELAEELERSLASDTTDAWVAALVEKGVPAGPILNYAQSLTNEHTRARAMVVEMEHPRAGTMRALGFPVKFSGMDTSPRLAPPLLGEHTEEVLRGLGYSESDIADLRSRNIV